MVVQRCPAVPTALGRMRCGGWRVVSGQYLSAAKDRVGGPTSARAHTPSCQAPTQVTHPKSTARTAISRSAEASMIRALLPPSSRMALPKRPATTRFTRRPT